MLVLLPRKELAFQVEHVVHQLAPNTATAVAVGKWKGMEEGVFPSIVLGTPKPVYEVREGEFGSERSTCAARLGRRVWRCCSNIDARSPRWFSMKLMSF